MSYDPEIRIEYDLTEEDTISGIRGPWQAFAEVNGAADLSVEYVIGRSLWSFVEGMEVREMYRMLLERVRATGRPLALKFNCDDRDHIRQFRLTISRVDEVTIRLSSTLLNEHVRLPVPLFDRSVPRSEEILSVCSVCKQIHCNGQWVPVEEAVTILRLMERETLPQLSHGLCQSCFERAMRELDGAG